MSSTDRIDELGYDPSGCLYEAAENVEYLTDDELDEIHAASDRIDSDGFTIRTDIRTANTGPWSMSNPVGILLHHTAGSERVDIPTLTRSGTGVSSNYYITRQGVIFEFAPYPRRCWHAGESVWNGVSDWNTHAIGIEIENYGNGQDWPEIQIKAVIWLCRRLIKQFPGIAKNHGLVARHLDVATPRGRKTDPHHTFPYQRVRNEMFAGASEPAPSKPAPFGIKRYNLLYKTEWGKEKATWIAETGNKLAGTTLFAAAEGDANIAYTAAEAYKSEPAGRLVGIFVGSTAVDELTDAQEKATELPKDISDLWDASDNMKVWQCIYEIISRERALQNKRFLYDYEQKFKVPVPVQKGGLSIQQLTGVYKTMPLSTYEKYLPHLNKAMAEYNINTPYRIAHFLAQLGHESGGLKYMEEIHDGSNYEWRRDLGNTQPGDGRRFKGRGPIQLTGRFNYAAASKALGIDLVSNPTRAADPDVGFRIAGWYWNSRNLNAYADTGDKGFDAITYRVNGGYNGYQDRLSYYRRAKGMLGI